MRQSDSRNADQRHHTAGATKARGRRGCIDAVFCDGCFTSIESRYEKRNAIHHRLPSAMKTLGMPFTSMKASDPLPWLRDWDGLEQKTSAIRGSKPRNRLNPVSRRALAVTIGVCDNRTLSGRHGDTTGQLAIAAVPSVKSHWRSKRKHG